jgi:hypothetical protein
MVLKLIKKLLSKENTMMADLEQKKQEVYLVWSKTERAGQIVQADDTKVDGKWLYFTDGTKVNKKLVNEYLLRTTSMAEAKSMSKTLGFEPVEMVGTTNGVVTPAPVVAETPMWQEPHVVQPAQPKAEPVNNIMMAMLEKMSKKNTGSMTVEINLPSREVYDMLIDQMDVEADELKAQIVLLIESQIDNMKQKLNEQIQLFTNNYYNDGTNTTSTKQKNAQSDSETKRNSKTS